MSVDAFRAALHGSGKSGHPESGRKGGARSEQEAYQDMQADLESGECVVFSDRRASGPTEVMFGRELLGTIPGTFEDIDQALAAVNAKMEEEGFFPNIYHINDHGNVSLWDGQGNTIQGWV